MIQNNYKTDNSETIQQTIDDEFDWQPVTGTYLSKFNFTKDQTGFLPDLYENYYNKTPYDFYKMYMLRLIRENS